MNRKIGLTNKYKILRVIRAHRLSLRFTRLTTRFHCLTTLNMPPRTNRQSAAARAAAAAAAAAGAATAAQANPVAFSLTPYNMGTNVLDYSTSEGRKHYDRATEKLNKIKYNC